MNICQMIDPIKNDTKEELIDEIITVIEDVKLKI